MDDCSVCRWLLRAKKAGGEVEICSTCGHLYVPYVEDCNCGIHTLPTEDWKFKAAKE